MENLLTALSITVSMSALLYAWHRDRLLKRKEYADRIRHAAGSITAKLERWRELALRFFDDIQPLITDADIKVCKNHDAIDTRDYLWRGLVAARSESSHRILEEKIEIAYVELYGYDARVRALFTSAINHLKQIDDEIFSQTLERTQGDVLGFAASAKTVSSAMLGNLLRTTCANLSADFAERIDQIFVPFRDEMTRLIEASDSDIFNKSVGIARPEDTFKEVSAAPERFDLSRLKDLIEGTNLDELPITIVQRKGPSLVRAYRVGGEVLDDTILKGRKEIDNE